jgi:hypothetical protein
MKDKTLVLYLVLALPFLEAIIESLINTLFFKFQNQKQFLQNTEEGLLEILKLSDPFVMQDEIEQNVTSSFLPNGGAKVAGSLEENVKYAFVIDIRINILCYKYRSLHYLRKIYSIFDTNFLTPDFESIKSSGNYCDPYKVIWNAISQTQSEFLRGELIAELDFYDGSLYPKLESEQYQLVMVHIRKKIEIESDDSVSHNSNLEIQKEDSLISSLDHREPGDINSMEQSFTREEEDSITKEG